MSDDRSLPSGDSSDLFRQFPLALARIVIGWHFLYEGFTKLMDANWTAAGYLQGSTGPFAGLFQWMASSEGIIKFVDTCNVWGLTLIGLGLMLGVLPRVAAIGGVALLALYYVAYPPVLGPVSPGISEGNYLLVNKVLVELCALAVIAAFPASRWGLGVLLGWLKKRSAAPAPAKKPAEEEVEGRDKLAPAYAQHLSRRELAASLAGVPFLGGFVLAAMKKHGWSSFEEINLVSRATEVDGLSGATVKRFQFSSLSDLTGHMPTGKIKDVNFSRMILGGNLMGGWAHARDLIYVSKLVKAYHNREKIFETFQTAEACGVNTILTNPLLCGVVNDYWRNGGKIQFISDCGGKDVIQMIQQSIDAGATACYVQGAVGDRLVEEENWDLLAKALELIRGNGLPAGIGGHKLGTITGCVDHGILPDFWMKTLHKIDYWSALPDGERKDNNWCDDPTAVAAYMDSRPEPWIAFKILAAGAITPEVGFKWAFEHGADFICVGMYDFQIVDDVNLACNVLDAGFNRQRPWRA